MIRSSREDHCASVALPSNANFELGGTHEVVNYGKPLGLQHKGHRSTTISIQDMQPLKIETATEKSWPQINLRSYAQIAFLTKYTTRIVITVSTACEWISGYTCSQMASALTSMVS